MNKHKFKIVVVKEYSDYRKIPIWFSFYNKGEKRISEAYKRIGKELKKRKIINRGTFYVFEFINDIVYIRKFTDRIPINEELPHLSSKKLYFMPFNILAILFYEMKKWVKYDE